MKWLSRIWSKNRVEKDPLKPSVAQKPGVETEKPTQAVQPSEGLEPYCVGGDKFQLFLSREWQPSDTEAEGGRMGFHHAGLDMDFLFVSLIAKIPASQLEETAKVWSEVTTESMDAQKLELGFERLVAQDEIHEQSWGYQVSILHGYQGGKVYRCIGLVGQNMILSFSFEGRPTPEFQLEVEKIMDSLSFSDDAFGDLESP